LPKRRLTNKHGAFTTQNRLEIIWKNSPLFQHVSSGLAPKISMGETDVFCVDRKQRFFYTLREQARGQFNRNHASWHRCIKGSFTHSAYKRRANSLKTFILAMILQNIAITWKYGSANWRTGTIQNHIEKVCIYILIMQIRPWGTTVMILEIFSPKK
jgi:hypothetical protein